MISVVISELYAIIGGQAVSTSQTATTSNNQMVSSTSETPYYPTYIIYDNARFWINTVQEEEEVKQNISIRKA